MASDDTQALARSIELPEDCGHRSDDDEASTVRGSLSNFSRTATCYPLFFASGRTENTDRTSCDHDGSSSHPSCFKRKRQGYFLISFISLIVLAGLAMIFVGYYLHNRGYLLVVGIIYPWVVGVPTCYVYCQYRGSRPSGRRRGSTIALSSAMSIEVPPPHYECRHQFTSVDYTYTSQTGLHNYAPNGQGRLANGRCPTTISCDDPPPPYEEVAGSANIGVLHV
ncbi:uncharacterized protein [Diadema antillarum]|uniref:uncharacterized protein n=1 Tax=Diadema antillarum TaxID=105358 RepID=UPI003A847E93